MTERQQTATINARGFAIISAQAYSAGKKKSIDLWSDQRLRSSRSLSASPESEEATAINTAGSSPATTCLSACNKDGVFGNSTEMILLSGRSDRLSVANAFRSALGTV